MLKVSKRKYSANIVVEENVKIKKDQDTSSEYIYTTTCWSDEEEKELEDFLFGNTEKIILNNDNDKQINDGESESTISFTISTKPSTFHTINDGVDNAYHDDHDDNDDDDFSQTSVSKRAWQDDDDEHQSIDIVSNTRLRKLKENINETTVSGNIYQDRLKKQFEKVLPPPAWADLDNQQSKDDSDIEDEIFNTAKKLTDRSAKLKKGTIDIRKLKNLNHAHPCSSTVTSLQFHPHAYIAFTTSLDKKLILFQADGKENRKLHSVSLQHFPIYTGYFSNDGDQIYMTSRRKYFYSYDLTSGKIIKIPNIRGCKEATSLEKFVVSPNGDYLAFLGNNGFIHLASSKTCHLISSFKLNGKALAVEFSPDSLQLFAAGSDGEIYVWNLKSTRCEHRFVDEGALKVLSMAVSKDSKYIASGSSSGVVNVYDSACLTTKYPQPVKSVMNLTTSIDHVCFNSTSELLCMSSPQKRNSLRLIHMSSLTSFSNWPIEKQTLGNVSCFAFSPTSEFLGIGNEGGKALLFRLNHFAGT